jgi:alpha-beta hydrolase superfamily lysophospholipase
MKPIVGAIGRDPRLVFKPIVMNTKTNAHHEFRFTSQDGLQIACSRWQSHGPARGIIQIAHGLGEHMGRYSDLIAVLQEAGLVVYANDHRGHGRTAASPQELGDFGEGGFDLLVQDMVELTLIAKEENAEKPFILLGHSMGSFAAQQYVLDHSYSIDGVVLSGSGTLDGLAKLARSAGSQNPNFLNASFEPARTPFDWLSRDPRAVDAFINDPLCFGALAPASTGSFLAASDRLADPDSLSEIRPDLPMYLFSGSNDPVGQQLAGVRTLIERYHKAGVSDISCDFYEGGRHEMLNEPNRGEVRTNLLVWLSGVLGDQSRQGKSQ